MSDSEKYDNTNRDTVFHYSREHRLSRASPEVQAFNSDSHVRPTLRKVIFGNRGSIFLFVSIIVISISGLIINFINREPSGGGSMTLGGNTLSVAILRVEESLILGIVKKTPESGEIYIGSVEIAISPAISSSDGEEPQIFFHNISFRPLASETFHISLPFVGDDFFIVARAAEEQKSMRIRVVDAE